MQTELFPTPDAHTSMHLPDRGDGLRRASCRCGHWHGQAASSDLLALHHAQHVAIAAPLEFAR